MTKLFLYKCQRCGREVLRYPTDARKRVYCSRKCYAEDNSRERSQFWNGGRIITQHGYVCLYKPDYPKANTSGYVYEHIMVAEQSLGRTLIDDEIVHHLNGIKSDNAPENLKVMHKGKHTTLHLKGSKLCRTK